MAEVRRAPETIATAREVHELLESLGAPERLIVHLQLVGEVADDLLEELKSFGIDLDATIVRLGAAVHDAGKIVFGNELDEAGDAHELAGEKLMREAGLPAEIARCCASHARYDAMPVSLEELLVALSDKLWKGKREGDLELRVVDAVADRLGKSRWDVFSALDECFERIASDGDERLARSRP